MGGTGREDVLNRPTGQQSQMRLVGDSEAQRETHCVEPTPQRARSSRLVCGGGGGGVRVQRLALSTCSQTTMMDCFLSFESTESGGGGRGAGRSVCQAPSAQKPEGNDPRRNQQQRENPQCIATPPEPLPNTCRATLVPTQFTSEISLCAMRTLSPATPRMLTVDQSMFSQP